MSLENVELVRRITVAFNRGDVEGLIALVDLRRSPSSCPPGF